MCNEKEQLKKNLKKIVKNNYDLQADEGINDYLGLMLKYIGDSDAELRDDLIYMVFAYWIQDKGYFDDEGCISLLNTLLSDDYAFYNIGSENDDSILRRSFSILNISSLLYANLNKKIFDEDTYLHIKNCMLRFLNEENDLRGYDEEKGWMHAIAHTADNLHLLLNCEDVNENICKEVLAAIEKILYRGKKVFDCEEDERIVTIIYDDIILDKLLDESYVCAWINGLKKVLEIEDYQICRRARVNTKNLVRSLYFRLMHNNGNEKILHALVDTEKKLNSFIK